MFDTPEDEEPGDLGSDLKFWRMSFELQLRLGRTRAQAKAHADSYIAKLKAAHGLSDESTPN